MLLLGAPSVLRRAAGWVLLAVMTVNVADAVDRLGLGDHAVFVVANARGLAVAAVCGLGFGIAAGARGRAVTADGARRPWSVPSRRVLAAAGAVGLAFAVTPLPSTANLGVALAGPLRIVFADLHADPGAINAELARRHLGLTIQFRPTSPSPVDTALGASSSADADYVRLAAAFDHRHDAADPSDAYAVTVPADLRGDTLLFVGRPARAGESYASTPIGGAEAPGEALHCHPVRGLTVAASLARFAAAGVTPIWRTSGPDDGPDGVSYARVAHGYVVAVDPADDHQILAWVSDTPPDPDDHDYQAVTAMDAPGSHCLTEHPTANDAAPAPPPSASGSPRTPLPGRLVAEPRAREESA